MTERDDLVVVSRSELTALFGKWGLPPWPDVDGNFTLGHDVNCAGLASDIAADIQALVDNADWDVQPEVTQGVISEISGVLPASDEVALSEFERVLVAARAELARLDAENWWLRKLVSSPGSNAKWAAMKILGERVSDIGHTHNDPPHPTTPPQGYPAGTPRRVIVDWWCDECGMVQRSVWEENPIAEHRWEFVRTIENLR